MGEVGRLWTGEPMGMPLVRDCVLCSSRETEELKYPRLGADGPEVPDGPADGRGGRLGGGADNCA